MISKSTVGFDTLDNLKSKKPVKSNPDIYKTGIDKVDIDKLSESEIKLITEFLSYGFKKKSRVKLEKLSAEKLLIICNILANRKAETDEILFNPKGDVLWELDELPGKRKDIVLEIIGSYRYDIAYTLSELREVRLEVQKKQRNNMIKRKEAQKDNVNADSKKVVHKQKKNSINEIENKPKKRRGRPPKQKLV